MPPIKTPFSIIRSFSRLVTRTPSRPFSSPVHHLQQQQRRQPKLFSLTYPFPRRQYSSQSSPSLSTSPQAAESPKPSPKPHAHKTSHKVRGPQPEYQITFTCTPCSTRSTHRISKQGYHRGSVLITCPECRNRHVISDHLNIFGDRKITIEDLMKEQGQLVKKGTLSEDGGDIEFWADEGATKKKADEEDIKS